MGHDPFADINKIPTLLIVYRYEVNPPHNAVATRQPKMMERYHVGVTEADQEVGPAARRWKALVRLVCDKRKVIVYASGI